MQTFPLNVPRDNMGNSTTIELAMGQALFVLGANGTGKSSLLQRFAQAGHGKKSIRRAFFSNLPTQRSIEQKKPVNLSIDTASIVDSEAAALTDAIDRKDWIYILAKCPVRESQALDTIARAVGLRDRYQYEAAVLRMLQEECETLQEVRSFFDTLSAELGVGN